MMKDLKKFLKFFHKLAWQLHEFLVKSPCHEKGKIKVTKEYKPRVVVQGNTGTRVMRSKKDKQNTRQALKLQLKNYY